MSRLRVVSVAVALILVMSAGGALGAAETAEGEPEQPALLDIDPANFDNSTTIDNEWWPLKPGTQLVYEGFTVDEERRAHPPRRGRDRHRPDQGDQRRAHASSASKRTTPTRSWSSWRSSSTRRTTTATSGTLVSTREDVRRRGIRRGPSLAGGYGRCARGHPDVGRAAGGRHLFPGVRAAPLQLDGPLAGVPDGRADHGSRRQLRGRDGDRGVGPGRRRRASSRSSPTRAAWALWASASAGPIPSKRNWSWSGSSS